MVQDSINAVVHDPIYGERFVPATICAGPRKTSKKFTKGVKLLFDTCAAVSVVQESWLQDVEHTRRRLPGRSFLNASGGPMGSDQFATFKLQLYSGEILEIKDALIADDNTDQCILFGQPELKRYKVIIDCGNNLIWSEVLDFSVAVDMIRAVYNRPYLAPVKGKIQKGRFPGTATEKESVLNNSEHENLKENLIDLENRATNSVTNIEVMSTVAVKDLTLGKTEVKADKYLLDAKQAYKRQRALDHEKRRNEYTIKDIEYDENFLAKNPGLKEDTEKIFQDRKAVFKNIIGKVPDEFAINGKIEGEFTTPRQSQAKRSPEQVREICKKLDQEFADGVLVFPEDHDITVVNNIPIMAVAKKDDNGNVLPFSSGMRLVNDCRRRLNRITKFCAMDIDSLQETLRKAAIASKHKYKCKLDISQAFYQIPTHKSLWKYFGTFHPELGQLVYTRLSQGWVSSFGWATNIFLRIFNKFSKWLFRYMDDCWISAPTKELFLDRLNQFLKTCEYYGITLKGSKFKMYQEEMVFLGHLVKNGKIYPSPHHHLKAKNMTTKDIKNVSDLRGYIGLCVFLCKHMRRSTDVFFELRKLVGKDGKTTIDWEANDGFLQREFDKSKKALEELTELTPFDEEKQAFVLVDSSKIGTGAILFQKSDDGKTNNVVEFYSRKRPDLERKHEISSCLLEAAGMTGCLNMWRRYLQDSKYPVVVFTDSSSLVAVAARFARNEIPSDVKLINNCFANILGMRVEVRHLAGKSDEIQGVDNMSRTIGMKECTDKCDVCKLASTPAEIPQQFVQSEKKYIARVAEIGNKIRKVGFNASGEPCDMYINFDLLKQGVEDYEALVYIPREDPYLLTEAICPVIRRPELKMSLEDLLDSHWQLKEAQAREVHLRKAKRALEKGEQLGPREERASTLVHKKNAYLEKGVLKYDKWIGMEKFPVIPIPVSFANVAIEACHVSFGCKSPTQMAKIVNRYFELANAHKLIDSYLKNCKKCVLLRRDATRQKREIKSIPVPTKIGEQIYVDEICRTDRLGKELKILFATEGLSRYAVSMIYTSPFTSEKFIQFMGMARSVLAPLHRKSVKVICRCDGASQHSSKQTIESLAKMGIEVEIFQSTTFSKNKIPEHDARIATFSRLLSVIMNNPEISKQQAVVEATVEYNQSISNVSYAPAEIFTGRKIGSQDLTNIELKGLAKKIEEVRLRNKKATEKFKERKKLKKKLSFIPWRNEALNDPSVMRKLREKGEFLKIGDTVKLNLGYEKNDLDRLFLIKTINWNERTFEGQKLNKPKGKLYRLSFDVIAEVITDYIRRISEIELQKDKAILAHFHTLGIEQEFYEKENTITEEEIINDLTRAEENQKNARLDDSGMPFSVQPPSVAPSVVPDTSWGPPSVKPVTIQEVDEPVWVAESELTEISSSDSDYILVNEDGSSSILKDTSKNTAVIDSRKEEGSKSSIEPVTKSPTRLSDLNLTPTSDTSFPGKEEFLRELEKNKILHRARHNVEMDKLFSDQTESENKLENSKARLEELERTIQVDSTILDISDDPEPANPDKNRENTLTSPAKVSVFDLNTSLNLKNMAAPTLASSPVPASNKGPNYKTTKERDKSKLPINKFIKNSAAGVIQVKSEGINSKEELSNFFNKKVKSRSLNKSSKPGGPILKQGQNVLDSLGTDGVSNNKKRGIQRKIQQETEAEAVRRSSRIAKLPDKTYKY